MAEKIKVLVVDDASFMVKAISEILNSDPGLEVVGSAKNGQLALEQIKALKPDVVTFTALVDGLVKDGKMDAAQRFIVDLGVSLIKPQTALVFYPPHGAIAGAGNRASVSDKMLGAGKHRKRTSQIESLEPIDRGLAET